MVVWEVFKEDSLPCWNTHIGFLTSSRFLSFEYWPTCQLFRFVNCNYVTKSNMLNLNSLITKFQSLNSKLKSLNWLFPDKFAINMSGESG